MNRSLITGGSKNHLSGCFRLFVPKFWDVMGTHECYFVILWLQVRPSIVSVYVFVMSQRFTFSVWRFVLYIRCRSLFKWGMSIHGHTAHIIYGDHVTAIMTEIKKLTELLLTEVFDTLTAGWVMGLLRGGGDPLTLPAVIKKVWTFCTDTWEHRKCKDILVPFHHEYKWAYRTML